LLGRGVILRVWHVILENPLRFQSGMGWGLSPKYGRGYGMGRKGVI
jgi:hypothetical protein